MSSTDKCKRCRGTGFRDTPRAHLSVPGLCFDCNGDGTRETQLKSLAERKESIRLDRLRVQKCGAIEEKIFATRQAAAATKRVPYDLRTRRWAVVQELRQFTTQQYADRCGITKQDAWVELCCNTNVYIQWSADFEPLGWTVE